MTELAFKGIVYKEHPNKVVMTVDQEDPLTKNKTPVDWTGVDRVVVYIVSIDKLANGLPKAIVAKADTNNDSSLVDYSVNGELGFAFGELLALDNSVIPSDEYYIRVTVYSGSAATVIAHEKDQGAKLEFVNVNTL